MLRFFGEPGFPKIVLFFQGDIGCDLSGPLTENQQKEFERIKRLFPEAEITAQLWESLYEENPALKAPQR